jgi:hypothetical protein
MNFREYALGRTVTLKSPLPPAALGERINASASSGRHLFDRAIVGFVRSNELWLKYRSNRPHDFIVGPTLRGSVSATAVGSILHLKYQATPLAVLLVVGTAVTFPLLGIILTGSSLLAHEVSKVEGQLLAGILMLAASALYFARYRCFNTDTDEELALLLDFLSQEAEATPQDNLQPPHPRHA